MQMIGGTMLMVGAQHYHQLQQNKPVDPKSMRGSFSCLTPTRPRDDVFQPDDSCLQLKSGSVSFEHAQGIAINTSPIADSNKSPALNKGRSRINNRTSLQQQQQKNKQVNTNFKILLQDIFHKQQSRHATNPTTVFGQV